MMEELAYFFARPYGRCTYTIHVVYVRYGTVHRYSIQVSHGPKDRAESHNGLLLSARLGTLDASPDKWANY